MYEKIINDTILKFENTNPTNEDILNELFENKELKAKQTNEIRRTTIIGQLANEIFEKLNLPYSSKIMAIGDIEYFGDFKVRWEKFVQKSLFNVDIKKLSFYDLVSQGTREFREKLFDYMNLYYNFPNFKEKLIDELIPTYSTTDGITMVLDTLRQKFSGKNMNFIFPEASFSAVVKNAEVFGFNNIGIEKGEKNNFFITKKQLEKLYSSPYSNLSPRGRKELNMFYFTSIGNPTGEKLDWDNFLEIINFIVNKDKNAIILLDNVYVGLLRKENSTKMFERIFKDEKLLNKIIFCESLSKTLGMTGIRIGWLWTLNKKLNYLLKQNIILKKAGFSKILNEFGVNLLGNLSEIEKFQNDVYNFISMQRENFLEYIKNNFLEFFDLEASAKINKREGIYALLKLNSGIEAQKVFAITGIIGVKMKFSDGDYIRYSFGNTNYF